MKESFLPGTEVLVRGLRWEVVEFQPEGMQVRVRLRGTGGMAGFELDVLSPFEKIDPVSRDFDPITADKLSNWLVYHQAFLLEQALGPDAFLAVQPGRLRIEPYQLVPLARALRLSRPRLLIADDVGLGKTIEAGLIIAELIARRKLYRLLIVTPAGPLLTQWQSEMSDRFGLNLEVVDRSKLEEIRRGSELGSNPFDYLSHTLASMDFLKQDRVLDELERSLPYDLIVIDEAHHYNETGLNESDRSDASQRRKLGEVLARKSDALLLLTATPHDGYDRSFTSLIELLDPYLLDGKGKPREDVYRNHVIRRLKKHILVRHPQSGEYVHFPERKIEPIEISLDGEIHKSYFELHHSLLGFIAPALKNSLRTRQFDDALAYLALLKRSTSSVVAVRNTLKAVSTRLSELSTSRQEELESRNQRRKSLKAFQRKMARFGTLTIDEEQEKEILEQEELAQQLVFFDRQTRKIEKEAKKSTTAAQILEEILTLAEAAVSHDLKIEQLISEIRRIRTEEPRANILIYTEYLDSLRAIEENINKNKLGPVVTIHGGPQEDRAVKVNRKTVAEQFRSKDNLILVSTDAAAEGLNLHDLCHYLIHFELPWNPNRLEQRNGRIDRYGQWKVPTILYFYLCGTFEERILARLMAKYERQRERLKFMPNTLGIDVNDLPETDLFSALASGEESIGLPCKRYRFTNETADETGDPDVKALLEEIDHSLNRFENIARTYKWLSDEGAATDQIYQQQAQRAFDTGQKSSQVDLLSFVQNALLSEEGSPEKGPDWLDFHIPNHWKHGLEGLPGWDDDDQRLRLTTNMERMLDDNDEPVGYLGRAHPLVKRAIEMVRHQSLGQSGSLDRRVSAVRSADGQKALLFTFLGRLDSKSGRELEQLIAVMVKEDLQVERYFDGSWMPSSNEGVATKGLWEREFQRWSDKVQKIAIDEATKMFADICLSFETRYKEQMNQEYRDLEEWFGQRVVDLLGKQEQSMPLFQGMYASKKPIERLREFIAFSKGRERSEAEILLASFEKQASNLQSRLNLLPPVISPLGILMSTPNFS